MEIPRFHFRRSTVALSVKAIAVLGATIAIYFQDLTIIANEAIRSELMSHIIARAHRSIIQTKIAMVDRFFIYITKTSLSVA